MKKMLIIILAFCFVVLTSCSFEKTKLNVRISAVSNSDGKIEFRVYPENEYGNIVTGAGISVKDSNNELTYLDFSNSLQCYVTNVNSTSKEFLVRIKSILLEKPLEYKIPR